MQKTSLFLVLLSAIPLYSQQANAHFLPSDNSIAQFQPKAMGGFLKKITKSNEYAKPKYRIFAGVIDVIAIFGILVMLEKVGLLPYLANFHFRMFSIDLGFIRLGAIDTNITVLMVLYNVISLLSAGNTIGKHLVGIKVIDQKDKELTFGQVLLRSIFKT
ncbi:MAG: RDD family protein, partial [Bacteroidota bacterium]